MLETFKTTVTAENLGDDSQICVRCGETATHKIMRDGEQLGVCCYKHTLEDIFYLNTEYHFIRKEREI